MLAPQKPSLPWRITSSAVMGATAAMSRAFLFGCNDVQVIGLPQFLELLDRRKEEGLTRRRGLITVSNHVAVLDDPLIWGVLPLPYAFDPLNHRWSLGAHDICFKNRFLSTFFSLGQVLPTHRLQHSPHGGLFQPTMTQAVRILSAYPIGQGSAVRAEPLTDTTGQGSSTGPASYLSNRSGWVHIFPEARVFQHPDKCMRYFKWGISRLILESDPAPDLVPMSIDGTQDIMPEFRKWPRWLPRIGNKIRVAFGSVVNVDEAFGDARSRWAALVARHGGNSGSDARSNLEYDAEAVALRIEVAKRVRDEVQKLRTSLGYPEGDPSYALAEYWAGVPDSKQGDRLEARK